jgi:hypothetical protein
MNSYPLHALFPRDQLLQAMKKGAMQAPFRS